MTNDKNKIIIAEQETGKTTFLYDQINYLLSKGKNIIILDSATEHGDKSLLRKVANSFENVIIINEQYERNVVLGKVDIGEYIVHFMDYFPFEEISKNKGKIICFDLSYFLEKGYEEYDKTQNWNDYKYYRSIYNQLANQIVITILLMEKLHMLENIFVIMDEIELPLIDYDINALQGEVEFLASVHPENAFGTFYKSFTKIKFNKLVRRKEF